MMCTQSIKSNICRYKFPSCVYSAPSCVVHKTYAFEKNYIYRSLQCAQNGHLVLLLIGWGILVCVLWNKASNWECWIRYYNSTYHIFEKLLMILPCLRGEEQTVNGTISSNSTIEELCTKWVFSLPKKAVFCSQLVRRFLIPTHFKALNNRKHFKNTLKTVFKFFQSLKSLLKSDAKCE